MVQRAAPAVTEWCEELRSITDCQTVNLEMRFDEFSLAIFVSPGNTPDGVTVVDRSTALLRAVAGHIQSRYDAKVSVTQESGTPVARLEFVH